MGKAGIGVAADRKGSPPAGDTPRAEHLFGVLPGSGDAIYRQLYDQVARRIAGGQLAAGALLPSVRDTARALAINPMTVSKAYSLLEHAGLLERRRGVGMVVAAEHRRAQPKAERAERLRPTLERAACEARQLGVDAASAVAMFERILKGRR
jgi:GntR family transcriptional regulator